MLKVTADEKLNLLLIELEGYTSDERLKAGRREIITKANTLKSGFTVINDISKMQPISIKGAKQIAKAQSYVLGHGVGKIIRVVGKQIPKIQFSQTSDTIGFTAIEATSIDEALEMASL